MKLIAGLLIRWASLPKIDSRRRIVGEAGYRFVADQAEKMFLAKSWITSWIEIKSTQLYLWRKLQICNQIGHHWFEKSYDEQTKISLFECDRCFPRDEGSKFVIVDSTAYPIADPITYPKDPRVDES